MTGVQFRYTPSSYHYSWHNAPNRQFIINLDADVEVEVSEGEKRIIKQGEVFFVEDITGMGGARVSERERGEREGGREEKREGEREGGREREKEREGGGWRENRQIYA